MSERILVATLMRPSGETGVQTHIRELAGYIGRTSRDLEIVSSHDGPVLRFTALLAARRALARISSSAAVRLYRRGHAWSLKVALQGRLARQEACTIYAQCPVSAEAALQARSSLAQRVVMAVHFNISQADEWAGKGAIRHNGRLYREIKQSEARILPSVDGLVFVSEFMKDELCRRMPALANRPSIICPNFIRHDVADAKCEKLGDLVSIGSLEPRKNQRYLIEILHGLRTAGRDVRLTIVGDGPDRGMLERIAAEKGVQDLVTFAGFRRDVAELLAQHRAMIHVPRMENLSLVLIEALSLGLPLFATPVGGTPEVFSDEIEGRYLPLDEPQLAARVIRSWLDDEGRLAKASQLARQRFEACFDAQTVGPKLHAFLVGAM